MGLSHTVQFRQHAETASQFSSLSQQRSNLEFSGANVYEPMRALLEIASHFCEVVVLKSIPMRFGANPKVAKSGNFWCGDDQSTRVRQIDRGNSLIRNSASLGPYSRAMPRALWWS